MYGPLKATSLLGRQTGSLCIRISSPLLCTELGEMPCIQSSRRIPPPRRLFSSHKQPFNQREKRVENEKCAQPWMIQNISISVDSDHRLCCQNIVWWGQCPPPAPFLLPPTLKLLCPWIGFMELWQSFSTVWLEFLSPDSTIHSKYLSTHWHLEEESTQPYTWKWFQLITVPLWQGREEEENKGAQTTGAFLWWNVHHV